MGCLKLSYYEQGRALEVNPIFFTGAVEKKRRAEKNCLSSSTYGFNGQEKDDEVKGQGNSYDFGFRMDDPRLGRFFSRDPFFFYFPNQSTYAFAGNSPIALIDADGGFQLPAGTNEGDFPVLTGVLKTIGELVEGTDEDILKNPIVLAFIQWGQITGTDEEKIAAVKNILTYGQGPIVRIRSDIFTRGIFGFNSNKRSVNINRKLIRRAEFKAEKLKTKNFDFDIFESTESIRFALFATILHEGVHLSARVQGIVENKLPGKLELGLFFENTAFPTIFPRPVFNENINEFERGNGTLKNLNTAINNNSNIAQGISSSSLQISIAKNIPSSSNKNVRKNKREERRNRRRKTAPRFK